MRRDPLSATLSALADPTRRAILAQLAQGEATVNNIARPFKISLPAVSRHLKVLENAGLVTRSIAGRDHFIAASEPGWRGVALWVERESAAWERLPAGDADRRPVL